jgi:hypothetical protein
MIIAIYFTLFEVVMYEYGVTQNCTLYLNVAFCWIMLFQAFANVETWANGGFDEGGDVIASV